jgi:nucleotide-binding universal stress UspA family protein
MALKDIVVFFDSDGDEQLRVAARLAGAHKARLTGIYVGGRSRPHNGYVRGQAIRTMIRDHLASEGNGSFVSCKRFTSVAAQYGLRADFRIVCDDSYADDAAVYNSLFADIVVIGQKAPHGLPEACTPDRLLSACGVPLLVVPSGWPGQVVPTHIAIWWKASPEARSAIAGAMPLMLMAQSVTIFVDTDDNQLNVDIARHLHCHGVRARIETISSKGAPMTEFMLSDARKRGTDLVIMGMVRRPHPLRIIFGDMMHAVLKRTTVPVLMSR